MQEDEMVKKIKVNIFDDMREARTECRGLQRGEAVNLRVTRIPSRPKQISAKEVRNSAGVETPASLFATYLM